MDGQISIWGLIADASLPVQLIMLLLMMMSLVSWAIIFQRIYFYWKITKAAAQFKKLFWAENSLSDFYRHVRRNKTDRTILDNVFCVGYQEFFRIKKRIPGNDEAIITGMRRAIKEALSNASMELEKHQAFLAIGASSSPYIGLFGTVWGIMGSFIALGAATTQPTLATVAPGIAEALIATAMGLFVAIPASIAFNRFGRKIYQLMHMFENFGEEFLGLATQSMLTNDDTIDRIEDKTEVVDEVKEVDETEVVDDTKEVDEAKVADETEEVDEVEEVDETEVVDEVDKNDESNKEKNIVAEFTNDKIKEEEVNIDTNTLEYFVDDGSDNKEPTLKSEEIFDHLSDEQQETSSEEDTDKTGALTQKISEKIAELKLNNRQEPTI